MQLEKSVNTNQSWFSTFPASTHAPANRVAATQLELASEIVHGAGTN